MFKKEILSVLTVAILVLAASGVQADVINGGFDVTKPGPPNQGITGTLDGAGTFDSYPQGVGTGLNVAGSVGTVTWDAPDGTTTPKGGPVDILGWAVVPGKGNPDTGKNGVGGSPGLNIFASWGGQQRVQSSVTSDVIAANTTYTIWAQIDGPAGGPIEGPLAFELMAGTVQLTADAALPSFTGGLGFQTITRTYTIGALPGGVSAGDPLTVVLGVQDTNTNGNRMIWDNVVIPEPSSLALLGMGGLMMMILRRRRA